MATPPTPPPGLDLDAEFINATPEQFTAVPNTAIRPGPHRLTHGLAVMVLMEYLSHRTGWKLKSPAELATEWHEGAGAFRNAVKDLERAGYVAKYKRQVKGGLWKYTVMVSADPNAPKFVEFLAYARAMNAYNAERAEEKARAKAGGSPMPVDNSAAVPEPDSQSVSSASDGELSSQVGPDADYRIRSTGFRSSGSGGRDSGQPDPVERHPIEDQGLEDQEKINPSSSALDLTSHPGAGAWPEEEEAEEQTWEEFAKSILVERGDWRLGQVRDVVVELVQLGRSARMIRTAMALAAADRPGAGGRRGTLYPRRLLEDACPFWISAARLVGDWTEEPDAAPSSAPRETVFRAAGHDRACQCAGTGRITIERPGLQDAVTKCPGSVAA